jgi:hypothetical protein
MHLVKLQHSNLPHYLGLTLNSKRVGVILVVNFPSGPKPRSLGLPSFVFRPNRKLCLVQRLDVPRPTRQTPFLKPSLANTYVAYEHVKPGVEPNPTFRLVTQATTWPPYGGPELGFN